MVHKVKAGNKHATHVSAHSPLPASHLPGAGTSHTNRQAIWLHYKVCAHVHIHTYTSMQAEHTMQALCGGRKTGEHGTGRIGKFSIMFFYLRAFVGGVGPITNALSQTRTHAHTHACTHTHTHTHKHAHTHTHTHAHTHTHTNMHTHKPTHTLKVYIVLKQV